MIKESDIILERWVEPGVDGQARIVIICDDLDHAELLKKQIRHCQRVEMDLDSYIRVLDDGEGQEQNKTQQTISKELTEIMEDKLFETPGPEDECVQ